MTTVLAGRSIAITRPARQAGELAGRLAVLGARVDCIPLIEITPVIPDAPARAAVAALDAYDIVVFTSVNGVDAFVTHLAGAHEGLPRGLRVVAVGGATAAALRDAGITVDVMPAVATGRGIVGALGDAMAGVRVLLPRARRGRPELPAGLRDAGAEVDDVAFYDTRPVAPGAGDRATLLEADAVVVTSPSAVEVLAQAAGSAADVRVVTIGPTTSAAAHASRLTVLGEAAEQSVDGLVAALVDVLGERPTG